MGSSNEDRKWRIDYTTIPTDEGRYLLYKTNYPGAQRGGDLDGYLKKLDCGQLDYKCYRVRVLRGFVLARGLTMHGSTNKRQTIKCLERADKNPRFPRFMELPPEIRVIIYEHSMSSIVEAEGTRLQPQSFAQPAISRVSSLTRSEALEVFYRTKEFLLAAYTDGHNPHLWSDPAIVFRLEPDLTLYMSRTNTSAFRRTRHLRVLFNSPAGSASNEAWAQISRARGSLQKFEVDFDSNNHSMGFDADREAEMKDVLELAMQDLAAHIRDLTQESILAWFEEVYQLHSREIHLRVLLEPFDIRVEII